MSAAPGPQSQLPEYHANRGSIGQVPMARAEGSTASVSPSLAMIHRAFGGLLDDARSAHPSSSNRQAELERSLNAAPRNDRAPNAFTEETYSFSSVRESEDHVIPVEKFGTGRAHAVPDAVGSVEFFDYLTAIGGI